METGELVGSLREAFASVPDPRSPLGRRHPLPAIFAMSVAAMLNGARSLYAIFQWGRLQPRKVVRNLGFRYKKHPKTPCVATLHRVFRNLDVEAFEIVLKDWAQQNLGDAEAIAIDGKGLRGIHGEELPGVRFIAAFAPRSGTVLVQKGGKPLPQGN
ncbi:MAG: transposase family protein [Chloroflexi bacterium]|nr:transposase family protein [Chloroflexota bacterium]